MRGVVPGLGSPYPLRTLLPAVLQEDEFTARFTAGLDDVLAPAISAMDCLTSYLDPDTAPADFVQWLASWFGEPLDENWPLERRRRAVAAAAPLYRLRGTVAGLRAQLELVTGGRVEVTDSGGVAWSTSPEGPLPGDAAPSVAVRVTVEDPSTVGARALEAVIRAVKPAHVEHRWEVSAHDRLS